MISLKSDHVVGINDMVVSREQAIPSSLNHFRDVAKMVGTILSALSRNL